MSFIKKTIKPFIFVITLCLISACSSLSDTQQNTVQTLQLEYLNAIKDAEVSEPNEISKDLIAIVPTNKDLIWKETSQDKRVLVVTWMNWNGYDDKIGQSLEATREIWVTVVPELKNFCKRNKLPKQNTVLRLEQLLGLPPNSGKTRFVKIWVNPKDLFRPSPDPEISDSEAELDFPSSRYFTISADYKKWFNDKKTISYKECGYPWTRLGYTFDWANPNNEVGLSEFVIAKGATIEIHSVIKNEDYLDTAD